MARDRDRRHSTVRTVVDQVISYDEPEYRRSAHFSELTFNRFKALPELRKLGANSAQPVVRFVVRERGGPHVRAHTVARDDLAVFPQYPYGTFHGANSHFEDLSKLAVARQPRSRRILARLDGLAKATGELSERRPDIVRIEFAHVNKVTFADLCQSIQGVLTELSSVNYCRSRSPLRRHRCRCRPQQKAPTGAATPAEAHIETLGVTMQVERTRHYKVKAVAAALDVSVATIYRAVESGALRAVRVGTGKGAVRIPDDAIAAYMAACEEAAATRRVSSEVVGDE